MFFTRVRFSSVGGAGPSLPGVLVTRTRKVESQRVAAAKIDTNRYAGRYPWGADLSEFRGAKKAAYIFMERFDKMLICKVSY